MKLTHKALPILFAAASMTLLGACSPYSSSVQVRSNHQISPNTRVSIAFSSHDRVAIRDYYYRDYKKKRVPPGHYKRRGRPFQKHQPLPQHTQYQPLPYELERRLPRLPADYIRIRIGEEFAIMNTRTRVIYDVMWLFD